jgi:DNA-binding transcriptional ArsR family regulator
MAMSTVGGGSSKESEIHGTTLRVYWHLLKVAKPVGVRETQRALSMSSPSTALYHLDKLRELGVVDKDQVGEYFVKEEVRVGTLKMFLKIGHMLLPRYLFYAVFLTTALAAYILEIGIQNGQVELVGVAFGAIGAGISWYECVRMWRERVV